MCVRQSDVCVRERKIVSSQLDSHFTKLSLFFSLLSLLIQGGEASYDGSVLQCVSVCCSVCCSVLQCVAVCCSELQCVAVCCGVMQCVFVAKLHRKGYVCCSALQCVAVCCSVLQREGEVS